MPGPHFSERSGGAGIMSRLTAVLWLVTALSILQLSPPALDASLFEPPATGGGASLANGDHAVPAVVEMRSTPALAVAEKRATGTRLLPAGPDGVHVAAPVLCPECCSGLLPPSAGTGGPPPTATAERPYTARSPPVPV